MLDRLAEPAGKDVIDIGCGGGALVRELTARGARVVGVEISEGQLAAELAQDDTTVWHLLRCRTEGRISNWQGTLWDLSDRSATAS